MKYITCLLLSCLLLLSRMTLANEYQVVVSTDLSLYDKAPVLLVPNDTHCLIAKSGIVGFEDHAARSNVETNEKYLSSCSRQHSDAIFYAVDSKGHPKLVFEFYKAQGKDPYFIPILVSPDLSCSFNNRNLEVSCTSV